MRSPQAPIQLLLSSDEGQHFLSCINITTTKHTFQSWSKTSSFYQKTNFSALKTFIIQDLFHKNKLWVLIKVFIWLVTFPHNNTRQMDLHHCHPPQCSQYNRYSCIHIEPFDSGLQTASRQVTQLWASYQQKTVSVQDTASFFFFFSCTQLNVFIKGFCWNHFLGWLLTPPPPPLILNMIYVICL